MIVKKVIHSLGILDIIVCLCNTQTIFNKKVAKQPIIDK